MTGSRRRARRSTRASRKRSRRSHSPSGRPDTRSAVRSSPSMQGEASRTLRRGCSASCWPSGPELSPTTRHLIIDDDAAQQRRRIQRRSRMRSRAIVVAAVLAGALVSGGWLMEKKGVPRTPLGTSEGAALFEEVLGHVRRDFVDTLPDSLLYRKAVAGVLGQ